MSDRTIVIGYDGSPASKAALGYAAGLAADGKLYVVCAAEPLPSYLGQPYAQHVLDAIAEHERALEAEIKTLMPPASAYDVEMLEGHPAEAILRVAATRDAEAIVVGSRGLGPIRAALGSVSQGVIHGADRPVIVVPANSVKRS